MRGRKHAEPRCVPPCSVESGPETRAREGAGQHVITWPQAGAEGPRHLKQRSQKATGKGWRHVPSSSGPRVVAMGEGSWGGLKPARMGQGLGGQAGWEEHWVDCWWGKRPPSRGGPTGHEEGGRLARPRPRGVRTGRGSCRGTRRGAACRPAPTPQAQCPRTRCHMATPPRKTRGRSAGKARLWATGEETQGTTTVLPCQALSRPG